MAPGGPLARVDLETVAASLRANGIDAPDPIEAEAFGRQLQVTAPDGLLVKINEIRADV